MTDHCPGYSESDEMNYRSLVSGNFTWLACLGIAEWERLLWYILTHKKLDRHFEETRARVRDILETGRAFFSENAPSLPGTLMLPNGRSCVFRYLHEHADRSNIVKREHLPLVSISRGSSPEPETLPIWTRSWSGKIEIEDERGKGDLSFNIVKTRVPEHVRQYAPEISDLKYVFILNRDVSPGARGRGIGDDLLRAIDMIARIERLDFGLWHLFPDDPEDMEKLVRGHEKRGYVYCDSWPARGYAIKGYSVFWKDYLERFGVPLVRG